MSLPMHAELLFTMLRWGKPPLDAGRLVSLAPADWAALCDLAAFQGVGPLLYARLREHALLEHVPAEATHRLAALHRASALRNLQIYRDLAQIVAVAHDVPIVALKGVALAAPLYHNVALRPMGDIDLLVPEAQITAFFSALTGAGYAPLVTDKLGASVPRHLPTLQREGGTCPLELHWRLATPEDDYRLPLDEIWARLVPLELPGCRVLGLAPEDLLLHLCAHATYQHELIGVGIRPFCDLAQLLTACGATLDWDALLERAARWNCGRGFALALRLAHDLVGAPLDPTILERSGAARLPASLLATAQAQLFTTYAVGLAMPAELARLASQTSLVERAAILWRRVFVSREALARQYQLNLRDPRLSFYYLARVGSLVRRHSSAALALAAGDEQTRTQAARRRAIGGWLKDG